LLPRPLWKPKAVAENPLGVLYGKRIIVKTQALISG
jgi:hypothetical protein